MNPTAPARGGHFISVRRLLAAAAVTAILLGLAASPAAAHAELRSTDPASGAALAAAPRKITLGFSEPVEASLTSIGVVGRNGTVKIGAPRHPGGASRFVTVEVPRLPAGGYAVIWRVVSADSHPIRGSFTFRVGAGGGTAPTGASLSAPQGSRAVGIVYGVFRFASLGGLLLVVGAGAFVLGLWRRGLRERRVRSLLAGAWAMAAVGTVGSILLQGVYAAGRPLADAVDAAVIDGVLDTRFGVVSLLRLALLAAMAFVMWALFGPLRDRPPPAVVGLSALVGVAAVATPGLAGPAAAAEAPVLMEVVDVVHLAAASVWLGGIAVLLVALLRGDESEDGAIVVRRFSGVALIAVVAVLATGTLQAVRQLGEPDALTMTSYGRLLLAKVAAFAAMVVLAVFSRRWVSRRYAAEGASSPPVAQLRRSVAAEAAGAVVVIALTSALVNAVPGRSALAKPFSATVEAGDVIVDVTVDPAKAGPADVHLYTLNRQGAVRDVAEVTAALALPSSGVDALDVPLRRVAAGHVVANDVDIPISGNWNLDLSVRVGTADVRRARLTIRVR